MNSTTELTINENWRGGMQARLSLWKEYQESLSIDEPRIINQLSIDRIGLYLYEYFLLVGANYSNLVSVSNGKREYHCSRVSEKSAKRLFRRIELKLFS